MRVLGIDPSLRNFGIVYAEVQGSTLCDVGFFQISSEMQKITPKYEGTFKRYLDLSRLLNQFCKEYLSATVVDKVYMEISTGSQDIRAAQAMAISTYVGAQIVQKVGLEYDLVTPRMLKKYLLQNSTAEKKDIINYLSTRFPDLPWFRKGGKVLLKNEHLADALAVLLWGLEKDGIKIEKALSNNSSPEWLRA